MKHSTPLRVALLAPLAWLPACLMPPSMYERATWGPPPPPSWQEQGRYRQEGTTTTVAPEAQAQPAPQAELGLASDAPADVPPADPVRTDAPAQPLYAWDGGVVDGAPQGRVTEQQGTPRGLETPPAGRAHIIELYQQALDERDALADEVERLRAALTLTTGTLEERTREGQDLTARVAALEESERALREENRTLAARLVQAQVRRLEAEKLLLEARIDRERERAAEAARLTTGQMPRSARTPGAPDTTGDATGGKP
jgi:hypothetical protein